MMTESAMVRGMLTALSWFGLKQRAFRHSDMDKALAFLGDAHESRAMRKALQQLRQDVANVNRRTAATAE